MLAHQPQGGRGLPPPNKLPIPRLDRRHEPPRRPSNARQNRVSRACLSCRARKIKCNGGQPKCNHCADNAGPCVYASSRKDRLKTATEHNQDLVQLLRDLRPSVEDAEQMRIDELLTGVTDDVADAALTFRKSPDKPNPRAGEAGEVDVSADVGSNEDLDAMDEDLLRTGNSRATGGRTRRRNGSLVFTMKLRAAGTEQGTEEGSFGPPGPGAAASAEMTEAMRQRQRKRPFPLLNTSNYSFYLDDEVFDTDFAVDALELPPFEIADKLLKCYLESVQSSFPILAKKNFVNQFYHYYAAKARGAPYKLPQKYQSMLNLVFAIGAAFSHLVRTDWRSDERDHLLYHSRAWTVSLKNPWWFSHPDLPQTQITGLLAFYYFAIGHINRAWAVIGMAVRFGVELGLHVRNEDRTASETKKEILSRVWWGLYSLERMLSAITGRPSVGVEAFCSISLPLPIPDEEIELSSLSARSRERPRPPQFGNMEPSEASSASSSRGSRDPENAKDDSNSGSYLKNAVRLGSLSEKVLHDLYSPRLIIENSWKDVQATIVKLSEELELWAVQLPLGLNFLQDDHKDRSMEQERNILRIHYYSTKILITRPCLCRLDRRMNNQTPSSDDFNQETASACAGAAKAIVALLPDDIKDGTKQIYEIFPWWAAVHYVMQSLAVLMLELSYKAQTKHEQTVTSLALKKLIRWLRALQSSNDMARRAYPIAFELLQNMVVHIDIDISDLLYEDAAEEHDIDFDLAQAQPYNEHLSGQYDFEQHSLLYDDATAQPLGGFSNAPDQGLPDFFTDGSLRSNSPLANLFLTSFDQYNSVPFSDDNYQMEG